MSLFRFGKKAKAEDENLVFYFPGHMEQLKRTSHRYRYRTLEDLIGSCIAQIDFIWRLRFSKEEYFAAIKGDFSSLENEPVEKQEAFYAIYLSHYPEAIFDAQKSISSIYKKAFQWSVYRGEGDKLEVLLKRALPYLTEDDLGKALRESAGHDHLYTVNALFEQASKLISRKDKWFALLYAAEDGYPAITTLFKKRSKQEGGWDLPFSSFLGESLIITTIKTIVYFIFASYIVFFFPYHWLFKQISSITIFGK
jgi:hypothetical protein